MKLVVRDCGIALLFLAVMSGCAGTGYVKVNLVTVDVVPDGDEKLESRLVSRQVNATPEIGDWAKVEDLTNLTGNSDRNAQISTPSVSPTQDSLVYYQVSGEESRIFRQSLDSPARSPITSSGNFDLTPTFTPKGDYLVFSSNRTGDSQGLWRVRSDGAGGITQITASASSFDLGPSVAADGETIVFQAYRTNSRQPTIWSVSMNGGLLTLLGEGETPRVSPDGRKIAFVRAKRDKGNKQIWVMNIDGSGQTQLTNTEFDDINPSWHPNGRVIVFASNQAQKPNGRRDFDVWLMRADGTDRVQLTENASHDDGPMFERKGGDIVFRSNRGGQWNLFSFKPKLD